MWLCVSAQVGVFVCAWECAQRNLFVCEQLRVFACTCAFGCVIVCVGIHVFGFVIVCGRVCVSALVNESV